MTEVNVKWADLAIPSYLYNPGVPKTDYGKTIYAIQLDVFGAGGGAAPEGGFPTVNFEYLDRRRLVPPLTDWRTGHTRAAQKAHFSPLGR